MGRWLVLSARWIAGSYHGSEWPPSPGRYFQALLAGAKLRYRGCEGSQGIDEAFGWLERQAPPVVLAPSVERGVPYSVFGPLNNWESLAVAWVQGKTPRKPPEELRSRIDFRPWYLSGIATETSSTVRYAWSLNDSDPAVETLAPRLCTLSSYLLALGWGVDLAVGCGRILSDSEFSALAKGVVRYAAGRDSPGAVSLAIPTTGWTERLESNFVAWSARTTGESLTNLAGTVPSGRTVCYCREDGPLRRPHVALLLQGLDGRPASVAWQDGIVVASWLRHASGARMERERQDAAWIRSYVMGHGDGEERNHRLSYVPLPTIGHPHADGRVRRALVVEPPGASPSIAKLLAWGLEGTRVTDNEGVVRARLLPLGPQDRVLGRYVREAASWASVTPVILHGHDRKGRRFSAAKAERLLREAFMQSGYAVGEIAELSYQPAPYWAGTGAASGCRVPGHLARWPRFHVAVRFRRPVPGPVLVGIGRHYGLGVFAALQLAPSEGGPTRTIDSWPTSMPEHGGTVSPE